MYLETIRATMTDIFTAYSVPRKALLFRRTQPCSSHLLVPPDLLAAHRGLPFLSQPKALHDLPRAERHLRHSELKHWRHEARSLEDCRFVTNAVLRVQLRFTGEDRRLHPHLPTLASGERERVRFDGGVSGDDEGASAMGFCASRVAHQQAIELPRRRERVMLAVLAWLGDGFGEA